MRRKSQKGGFLFGKFATDEDKRNVRKAKKKGSAGMWWVAKKMHEKEQKHIRQKGGAGKKRRKKQTIRQKGGILKYLQPWKVGAQDAEAKRERKRHRKELKHRHPELYKHLGRAFFTGAKIPKKYIQLANYYGYETEFDGTPIIR